MASILFAAGLLSYESIKKSRAKRAEKKAFNQTRFSELEQENAERIARLQGVDAPPLAITHVSSETNPENRYKSTEEAGTTLAHTQGPRQPMYEDEVRRINEERRKKGGGFTKWVSKRRGKRRDDRDAVIR